jgi:hypothetical protein
VSKLTGMDPESPWTKALGFGAEVAGDPLTYLGFGAGKLAGMAAKGGEAAASGVGALSPLRRTFGMVKGVQALPEAESAMAAEMAAAGNLPRRAVIDPAAKFIGEKAGPLPRSLAGEALAQDAPYMATGDVGGMFYPKANFGISSAADPTANRHEVVHGLINAAVQNPAAGRNLPLAMRVPAALERAGENSPFLKGVGRVLNEAAAHGYENRGALNQMGGYARFLMEPTPAYSQLLGETSPLAAAIYRSTPYGVAGGLGVGAGGLGYLAMRD